MTTSRAGFSLVEIIISMLILSVGVLAMGASTGYVLSEVRLAGLRTDRNVAVSDVGERLRAANWETLGTICASSTFSVGRYQVDCEVKNEGVHLKKVLLISTGPGYVTGGVLEEVADTTAVMIAEPT